MSDSIFYHRKEKHIKPKPLLFNVDGRKLRFTYKDVTGVLLPSMFVYRQIGIDHTAITILDGARKFIMEHYNLEHWTTTPCGMQPCGPTSDSIKLVDAWPSDRELSDFINHCLNVFLATTPEPPLREGETPANRRPMILASEIPKPPPRD